ncbi:lipase family protein [Pseudomonas hefeiensis]|uniref:Lipase family protein n=1 Tax=Pseudomonas hefeiensis TaxID=2738125 RepID=A0ABY9GBP2_9PSED|nr:MULTISPECIES: lipase family protein [unclassified Pseudomonas]WLH12939.1 lipase family protein [Pseudomonas sp. FP205]WLH96005.1 lipase family protein [Pseudomonas sp. FP53]WLI40276.1 lipase family protein [Pseudomonas sp. FP821]
MAVSNKEMTSSLSGRMVSCPRQGKWTTFQLTDEFGSGEPYAGLAYTATDAEGLEYHGQLDTDGTGKVANHCAGPIAIAFTDLYQGNDAGYNELISRKHYPLKITELQVRAEQTRYLNSNAARPREKPAQTCADEFFQVEVRHLVQHATHLPPEVNRHYPPGTGPARLIGKHGKFGVALMPQRHTMLEVRPLRALRPMLSTAPGFCALNLYQLALMSTLTYCPFGQTPDKAPIETSVSFTQQPSVGNWFADALAKFEEIWKLYPEQTEPYFYPLYEDVPYSKRLEIVPFDPALYAANDPELGVHQEHPANIHFLDDTDAQDCTDTQAFITHNDELILIAVRGTQQSADGLRDADALQVPFEEGDGHVHRGFYRAAKQAATFVTSYLDRFYAGQKLLICGHSLGGAVALLLSEMLRRRQENYSIQLYTYGAPRAADSMFIKNADALMHYRMVNHNDPVPSLPGSWMNTKTEVYGAGMALMFANVPLGLSVFVAGIINWTGEAYEHHGILRHFLPVELGRGEKSSILWTPSCDTITQHAACEMALHHKHGLPNRPSFLAQLFDVGNHFMVPSYIPACWATLRRWQQAQTTGDTLVTRREYEWMANALDRIVQQLRDENRHLTGRGAPNGRSERPVNVALAREIDKIQTTHARLTTLRNASVSGKDVYGSMAEQPERLAQSLARWQAHPQNSVAEQLAMAPIEDVDVEVIGGADGYAVGKRYTLDVDTIT